MAQRDSLRKRPALKATKAIRGTHGTRKVDTERSRPRQKAITKKVLGTKVVKVKRTW